MQKYVPIVIFIGLFCVSSLGWSQSSNKENDNPPKAQEGSDSKLNQGSGSTNKNAEGSSGKDQGSGTQGSGTQGSETTGATDEAFERFAKAIQELQINERRVNQLVISMPVGFANESKAQKEKISALKQRNIQLSKELLPNAIESYEKFPNTQVGVNNYLLQHMQSHLTGKKFRTIPFDPFAAKKFYQMLFDGGMKDPNLSLFGYRMNYILNDFEASRLLLIEAATLGHRKGQPAMNDLRVVTGNWHRELEFRKADSEANLPRVKMELDVGDVVVELFEDQAPNTVANFISLVESGFYDNLTFNQVSVTQVAVAGSPTDDGMGGPGYAIKDECEGENIRHHFTGVISMFPARKDGGGSRFMITKQPRPNLDGKVTAFGRIIEGLENLYKIQIVDRRRGVLPNSPLPTVINKMTVLRKRDHEYKPVKITETTPGGFGG